MFFIKLKVLLALILAITMTYAVYIQSTFPSNEQHQSILHTLQKIDKHAVLLNQKLLEVHYRHSKGNNEIIQTIIEMEGMTNSLEHYDLGLHQHKINKIVLLQHVLTKLALASKRFLSINTALNESLDYFSTLANETKSHPIKTALAQKLLDEVFLFYQFRKPESIHKIEKLLSQLSIGQEDSPSTSPSYHTQIIYQNVDRFDQEMKDLFPIQIEGIVTSIRQQYLSYYLEKRQITDYLNGVIYSISFIFLLIISNYISALRISTKSLNISNKKLRSEVQQRKTIEDKQQSEAIFLQTILDNISDGIVVCDNQGTLVVFNKAAEKMYGQGLKKISSKEWARQYHLYDKNGEQLLTKEQLPLFKALTKGRIDNEEIVIKPQSSTPRTVLINGTQLIKNNNKEGAVICIRDISALKTADTEMRLAAIAFEAHEAILIADINVNIVRINKKFTDITGYTLEDVLGKNPKILSSDLHDSLFFKALWGAIKKHGYWQGEIFNKHKNGAIYQHWMSISVVRNANNEVSHYISHFRDITKFKQQQQQIKRQVDEESVLTEILHASFLPLEKFLHQAATSIVSLSWLNNEPKCGIFLKDKSDEQTLVLASSHNLPPELKTLCAKVPFGYCHCGKAAQEKKVHFNSCFDHPHKNSFPKMELHGHYNIPIIDNSLILGVLVVYLAEGHKQQDHEINFLKRATDVLSLGISRQQAMKKTEILAYHDGLTGLPNRMLLMDRLEQVIAASQRQKKFSALLYIDFDRFKNINDSLGHSIGDALLQEIAERFKNVTRKDDTVARLGGDEFVVLLSIISANKQEAAIKVEHIVEKLHAVTAKEIQILGHSLFISLSIGIVIFSGENESSETLMIQADTAMYQAKENGRNGSQFFIPEMQAITQARLELEKDLRHALERNEIQVFYQPQTNSNGVIIGAEALLRWIHPQKGFVSPVDFIPLAEESGIILNLGDYVLKDACQKITLWNDISSLKHIAVNVSPVQFRQPNFVDNIRKIITQENTISNKLTLELTEGILVDNVEDVIEKMQELKQLGISFSIDDFGTGYSSLAYLTRFPLDQLKIDKSFVDDIGKDQDDQIIIETIIAMAERLGFNLIAEGVETVEQIQFLKDKGCFNFQGYYFSKPLPGIEFSKKYL